MDFDADGIDDLISGSYDPGEIYLFRGEGKGKFKARETLIDKSGKPVLRSPTRSFRSSRSEAGRRWSTGMEMGTSTSFSADTMARPTCESTKEPARCQRFHEDHRRSRQVVSRSRSRRATARRLSPTGMATALGHPFRLGHRGGRLVPQYRQARTP